MIRLIDAAAVTFGTMGQPITPAMLQRNFYSPFGKAQREWLADVDGDGDIDADDVQKVIDGSGSSLGDPGYSADLDIDADGAIGASDLLHVTQAITNGPEVDPDDPFGAAGVEKNALWRSRCLIGYAGTLWDGHSALWLMRHRWYDPDLGTWITRDPAGYVDGMCLYRYVRGNPLVYFDPFGLEAAGIKESILGAHMVIVETLSSLWQAATTDPVTGQQGGAPKVENVLISAAIQTVETAKDRAENMDQDGSVSAGDYAQAAVEVITGADKVANAVEGIDFNDGNRTLNTEERISQGLQGGGQMLLTATGTAGAAEKFVGGTAERIAAGKAGQGVAGPAARRFSKEKQALVDMARSDKRIGITKEDMKAYEDLNKQLPDPFPDGQVRGPEAHPNRGPHSQEPHGHVGPVDHIPVKDGVCPNP